MKKFNLSLTAVITLCALSFSGEAQNDSTWLDAGNLKLKRNLTQGIAIKGEDLEKMPFTTLSDAIGAWIYGAYSSRAALVYVVDGNVLSDVNIYSVHDIKEVVYVQNALADLYTAGSQQQVVLITTKRQGAGGLGLTLSAQTNLVKRDFNDAGGGKGLSSYTNVSHDYYAGINKDYDRMSFGISANFQRDVFPAVKADSFRVLSPENLVRWRLNGYFAFRPDKNNDIILRVGYIPRQKTDSNQYYATIADSLYAKGYQHQHLVTPSLSWQARFGNGWKNELMGGYLFSTNRSNYYFATAPKVNPTTASAMASLTDGEDRHVFIRDRFSYTWTKGDWNIEPSFNAEYGHWSWHNEQITQTLIYQGGTGTFPIPTATSLSSFQTKGDIYMLTPSVSFWNRESLLVQGGVLYNASKTVPSSPGGRLFPFVNIATDLLKWAGPDNKASWKFFGSYAKRAAFTPNNYLLGDLSGTNVFMPFSGDDTYKLLFASGTFTTGSGPVFTPYPGMTIPSSYWIWEAGTQLSVFNNRLEVHYNFERRNYTKLKIYPIPIGGNGVSYYTSWPELSSSAHYMGVSGRILDGGSLYWQSGLNLAIMRTNSTPGTGAYMAHPIGDFAGDKTSLTGGWVNQFRYKDFSLGLNLVYHFNEGSLLMGGNRPSPLSSVLLQYIYAAYKLHVLKPDLLEVYADCRNLSQNRDSDLTDRRRYVGAGVKVKM